MSLRDIRSPEKRPHLEDLLKRSLPFSVLYAWPDHISSEEALFLCSCDLSFSFQEVTILRMGPPPGLIRDAAWLVGVDP
jgi:hypothetical protein